MYKACSITLSSSLLLDDDIYQYTLLFNIYYFVVQPRLDDDMSYPDIG